MNKLELFITLLFSLGITTMGILHIRVVNQRNELRNKLYIEEYKANCLKNNLNCSYPW